MNRKRPASGRMNLHTQVEGFSVSSGFRRIFEAMADELAVPPMHKVDVVLASSDIMRSLKLEHFGLDIDTDVIAFPTAIPELGPDVHALIGELFIGIETVFANAGSQGWSPSEEFVFVVAHGLLHLLGWEDGTDAGRRKMFAEQERLLRLLRGRSFDLTHVVERVVNR